MVRCMAATLRDAPDATPVLNFDVIRTRAEALRIGGEGALADFLGVDRTTLWRWRKGLVVLPLDTAKQVADRLGVSLDELLSKAAV